MDYQQKLLALKAIGGSDTALHIRGVDNWYIRVPGIEIKDRSVLRTLSGDGETPEEAVSDCWNSALDVTLVKDAMGPDRAGVSLERLHVGETGATSMTPLSEQEIADIPGMVFLVLSGYIWLHEDGKIVACLGPESKLEAVKEAMARFLGSGPKKWGGSLYSKKLHLTLSGKAVKP